LAASDFFLLPSSAIFARRFDHFADPSSHRLKISAASWRFLACFVVGP